MMGAPPSPFRGRMPVFYYLSEDEVADAYLYLKLYPPQSGPDPAMPATELKQAASKIVPVGFGIEQTTTAPPTNTRDLTVIVFPVAAALLLAGGLWFTLREIRRLTALYNIRKAVVMGDGSVAQQAPRSVLSKSRPGKHALEHSTSDNATAGMAKHDDEQPFHHHDYHTFESPWLARWLKGEDEAA
jgi:hypothetical protein